MPMRDPGEDRGGDLRHGSTRGTDRMQRLARSRLLEMALLEGDGAGGAGRWALQGQVARLGPRRRGADRAGRSRDARMRGGRNEGDDRRARERNERGGAQATVLG